MDDTTTFADMARELGLPKKLLYSVKEMGGRLDSGRYT